MTSMTWSNLYAEAQAGSPAGLPAGGYDVEVTGVRTLATSRMLFFSLGVLSGPHAGKTIDVGLWLPTEGSKAVFHFQKKIAGFGDMSSVFAAMDTTPDIAEALDLLANSLVGKTFRADIGLVTEGDYAGKNELKASKPLDSAPAPAPASVAAWSPAPTAVPAPAPVAVPAPSHPVAPPGVDEPIPF